MNKLAENLILKAKEKGYIRDEIREELARTAEKSLNVNFEKLIDGGKFLFFTGDEMTFAIDKNQLAMEHTPKIDVFKVYGSCKKIVFVYNLEKPDSSSIHCSLQYLRDFFMKAVESAIGDKKYAPMGERLVSRITTDDGIERPAIMVKLK